MRSRIFLCVLMTAPIMFACGWAGWSGPEVTVSATSTPAATRTPTLTPTPSVTPSITPIPLVAGPWSGVAEGWKPPLTVAFTVVAKGDSYQVEALKIFIPEIDMARFAATLIQTTCTIQVEQLEIVENRIVYPAGAQESARIFEARFDQNGAAAIGWLYGGWLCEDKPVRMLKTEWHAEAQR
jgi:hypothetical protein